MFLSGDSVFPLYKKLKSSFKHGGFTMRKWVSNSAVLRERIEESESQSPPCLSSFKQLRRKTSGSRGRPDLLKFRLFETTNMQSQHGKAKGTWQLEGIVRKICCSVPGISTRNQQEWYCYEDGFSRCNKQVV